MLQKGEITKRMREAINALGLDCTYHKAQEWLNKKYGKKLVYSESTYYSIRRLMKLDQEKKSRPSISSLVDNPPIEQNGIATLVAQLKIVVTKIGKNEAKQLIDVL